MLTAREKVWMDRDGNLVGNDNPAAAVLVALKGAKVSEKKAARYPNAAEFFDGFPKPADPAGEPTKVEPPHARRADKRHSRE